MLARGPDGLATANRSRARSYGPGRKAGKWLPAVMISWIEAGSARCTDGSVTVGLSGGPDLESTSNNDDKARTTVSSDEKRREPGIKAGRRLETDMADARSLPLGWFEGREEKAEGSWFLAHAHRRQAKKERKRNENKNIREKGGKRESKQEQRERKKERARSRCTPLNTVETSGLIRD